MSFGQISFFARLMACAALACISTRMAQGAMLQLPLDVTQQAKADGSVEYQVQVLPFPFGPVSTRAVAPDGTEFHLPDLSGPGLQRVEGLTFGEVASRFFGAWTIREVPLFGGGSTAEYQFTFSPFALESVFHEPPHIVAPADGATVDVDFPHRVGLRQRRNAGQSFDFPNRRSQHHGGFRGLALATSHDARRSHRRDIKPFDSLGGFPESPGRVLRPGNSGGNARPQSIPGAGQFPQPVRAGDGDRGARTVDDGDGDDRVRHAVHVAILVACDRGGRQLLPAVRIRGWLPIGCRDRLTFPGHALRIGCQNKVCRSTNAARSIVPTRRRHENSCSIGVSFRSMPKHILAISANGDTREFAISWYS